MTLTIDQRVHHEEFAEFIRHWKLQMVTHPWTHPFINEFANFNDIPFAKSERNWILILRGATEIPDLLQCTISGLAGHAPWQPECQWALPDQEIPGPPPPGRPGVPIPGPGRIGKRGISRFPIPE
jgi:hypothetical protein